MNYPGGNSQSYGMGAGFANKFKGDSKMLASSTADLQSIIRANVYDGSRHEIERITYYYLYWNFYQGLHYRDHNESMMAFNYSAAFINKVVMFFLGKDAFTLKVSDLTDEQIDSHISKKIEKAVMYHWAKSKRSFVTHEIVQMGSVCGDAWVLAEWDELDKCTKVKCLDSRQAFPEFEDGNYEKLKSFTLRFTLDTDTSPNKAKLLVYKYTKNAVERWYQRDTSNDPNVQKWKLPTLNHGYGFIPIVHIKNKPYSPGYYSKSDMADTMKLNKIYNELAQEQKAIIDYHATPTTIITGANSKNLTRGLGKIWSGLPAEANVFNLGLDVDMGASDNLLKTIKGSMHELSDVPESTMGKLQAISNTSGAALNITYQPLVQQADLKAITYGEGFTELNTMLLRIQMIHDRENKLISEIRETLPNFLDDMRISPVFTYGLPQDRQNELNMGLSEINAGIGSKAEIMKRLGKHNIEDLLKEIDAEKEADMQLQARGAFISSAYSSMGNEEGEDEEENSEDSEEPAEPEKIKPTKLDVPDKNNESVNGKFSTVKKTN